MLGLSSESFNIFTQVKNTNNFYRQVCNICDISFTERKLERSEEEKQADVASFFFLCTFLSSKHDLSFILQIQCFPQSVLPFLRHRNRSSRASSPPPDF